MNSHRASRQYRKKIVIIGREDDALLENGRLRYLSTNNDDTWWLTRSIELERA